MALEKGWYQVAVTKVMTGIGISVVGVPVGILAYFFFFGAEYQKRSCNYVRGILCGLPEKVTGDRS